MRLAGVAGGGDRRAVTERFTDRADDYRAARPSYPQPAVDLLLSEEGLGPAAELADVGCGTGILAGQLLASSPTLRRVYGVEPNADMRAAAEEELGADARFIPVNGTGERTGLADDSVDGVTVAQAFHWLDFDASRREFRRIVRSGGGAAVLWNLRSEDRDGFHREYEAFLRRRGREYLAVRARWDVRSRLGDLFSAGYRRAAFPTVQRLSWQGLRRRLASSSYAPELSEGGAALGELEGIFGRSEVAGVVEMVYECEVHWGTL